MSNYLLLHALLPTNVKFRNYAFNPDVLATLAYWRAFFAPTLDFAFAAIQTCRLFGIHSLTLLYVAR